MRKDGSVTFTLPLEQILEDRNFNIRIFFGDIDLLAIQLMTEGQLDPLKVRRQGDQFYVVDGHRRQRAFERSRRLRIETAGGRHVVLEDGRPLREAPGPVHENFDTNCICCRLVDNADDEPEVFASQLAYNSGKPFTLLERMIFLSRLSRLGPYTREQLALKTGFSRSDVAGAQNLNAADPRLLDCVREGRVSQKLALRLLRVFPPEEQMAKLCAAMADAERNHRDKILPADIDWGRGSGSAPVAPGLKQQVDPVRARLHDVASRLGDELRFAPNPTAQDRLATMLMICRFATGKLPYAKLESHLLGRE